MDAFRSLDSSTWDKNSQPGVLRDKFPRYPSGQSTLAPVPRGTSLDGFKVVKVTD